MCTCSFSFAKCSGWVAYSGAGCHFRVINTKKRKAKYKTQNTSAKRNAKPKTQAQSAKCKTVFFSAYVVLHFSAFHLTSDRGGWTRSRDVDNNCEIPPHSSIHFLRREIMGAPKECC